MTWIQVLLIACHTIIDPITCREACEKIPVVDNTQDNVTLTGCMSLMGMQSARNFQINSPLYRSWRFKGWACSVGNSKPREEAHG